MDDTSDDMLSDSDLQNDADNSEGQHNEGGPEQSDDDEFFDAIEQMLYNGQVALAASDPEDDEEEEEKEEETKSPEAPLSPEFFKEIFETIMNEIK
jgi:hypothetical protein